MNKHLKHVINKELKLKILRISKLIDNESGLFKYSDDRCEISSIL